MAQTRTYTADFYCFEQNNVPKSTALYDLLNAHVGGHAPAHSIDDPNVKYQIRSINRTSSGSVFKAVFGKLRHDGTPEQASEHEDESDVELKPGHGLVEKNHFLFFPDINLVVFQRNGNAGRNSHLQTYLNKPAYSGYVLVPILTRDSYSRLMNGGPMKKLEISLRKPALAMHQEDIILKDYIAMIQNSNAGRMKLVLSASTGESLLDKVKDAAVTLSRFGRTRVARATMVEDNEIIDLVLDRVVKPFQIELQPNGRPDPQSLFSGLAKAKDACSSELKAFFNP